MKQASGDEFCLVGETINSGADPICEECKFPARLEVVTDGKGSFVGTKCLCGLYTRETKYFRTEAEAEAILTMYCRKQTNKLIGSRLIITTLKVAQA